MSKKEINLQDIYINQMVDVRSRLISTQHFINAYLEAGNNIEFDCAILQFRKALEATAYASISPNKERYREFRLKGQYSSDFTKDYNATKIFQYLKQVNTDFYPLPLSPPTRMHDETWHFGRKKDNFLTKEQFSKIYDRLGKFLHADNPWDSDKQRQNIAKDIVVLIPQLCNLLKLHATFIRSKNYCGVWVVEVSEHEEIKPRIITAVAPGDFKVD